MRRFLLAVLVVCSLAVGARAQGLEFDAVAYRLDANRAQVELYYGALYRTLNFKQAADGWRAAINARVEIRKNGTVVASQDISKDVTVKGSKDDLDKAAALKVLDGVLLTAPYDDGMEAILIWNYQEGGKTKQEEKRVPLTMPKPGSEPTLGGIELASDVVAAIEGNPSPFEKVGYVVTPNPSSIYGDLYTKLYYYTEIYVPDAAVNASKEVDVTTRIIDPNGKEMYSNTRKQALSQPVIPYIGTVDIEGLPTDRYRLEVSIRESGELEANGIKSFFYDSGIQFAEEESPNIDAANEEMIFGNSEIARLSEKELEDRILQAKIISSQSSANILESGKNVEEKRQNLYGFWRSQDGEGAPLSAYKTYYDRVAQIDKKYRYQKTPGWKTDRGRVTLKYGEPGLEDLNPHGLQTRAYMTWQIESYRGARLTSGSLPKFVFVDRQGGGNYVLVHSNVEGEVSNPNWYDQEVIQMR